jgi:hypothetical protein
MRARIALALVIMAWPSPCEAAEYPEKMHMVRIEPVPGKAGQVSWVLAADPNKVQPPAGMKKDVIGGPYWSQEEVNADYKKLALLSVNNLPVLVRVYDSAGQLRPEMQTTVRTSGPELQGQYPADQELTNLGFKLGQNEGTPIPARAPATNEPVEPGSYRTTAMTGEVTVLRDTELIKLTPQNVARFILKPGDRIYTVKDSSLLIQTAGGPQRVGENAEVKVEEAGKFDVRNGAFDSDTTGSKNISVETPTAEIGPLGNP